MAALVLAVVILVTGRTVAQTQEDRRLVDAATLMEDFAARTGLTSDRAADRYLWTDSFAVCTFLGLATSTGDTRYTRLALALVDQVHRTLGRHRTDDRRSGWLSGLDEDAGQRSPTKGGLRIGKPLPERTPDAPYDERLEWDRDGQYFHYLTKWMHALDQASRIVAAPRLNAWARDLAHTAFHGFTYVAPGPERRLSMHWKMSIDLSRPLVPTMGQHDALDGYVTYLQLETTAAHFPASRPIPTLEPPIQAFDTMIDDGHLFTTDPLGLGGLLLDAARSAQLRREGAALSIERVETLLEAAIRGLEAYLRQGELRQPATRRLAFRELGLAIGLHAVARTWGPSEPPPTRPALRAQLERLNGYLAVGTEIERFWLVPEHQETGLWLEHRNINDVMLATSLVPEGMVVLGPLSEAPARRPHSRLPPDETPPDRQ